MAAVLQAGVADLESITRAQEITISSDSWTNGMSEIIYHTDAIQVAIVP